MGEWQAVLHVDGASFGNPGPSGIGVVLLSEGRTMSERSQDIGYGTNNEAEYRALIAGLGEALDHGIGSLLVRSDSQLLVRQMNGEYRVKERRLATLKAEAEALARRFERVAYEHVLRGGNARADELAKAGAEAAAARGVRPPQGELLE
jgi:ribonuclease HI